MSFIGIVCDNKNENYIKQILNKKLQNKRIIFFTEESIENLKNIKFEIIIIMNNNKKIFSKEDILKIIISKAKYLLINADEDISFVSLENIKLITYGFNSKSTITASSVNEEGVLLCVQRTIQDFEKKEIEPQEIYIEKINIKLSTNILLGIASILLLYGIENINI